MSYNVPDYTVNNFSYGPGKIFIGPTGATPSTDVGGIDADAGVTMEVVQEIQAIDQGNPAMPVDSFAKRQGLNIDFAGIEWNYNRLAEALGTASTAAPAGEQVEYFGGDPTPNSYALQIEHAMAKPGHTLLVDVWQVQPRGGQSITLNQDLHSFPYQWMALRSTTNWAAVALTSGQELFRRRRITA